MFSRPVRASLTPPTAPAARPSRPAHATAPSLRQRQNIRPRHPKSPTNPGHQPTPCANTTPAPSLPITRPGASRQPATASSHPHPHPTPRPTQPQGARQLPDPDQRRNAAARAEATRGRDSKPDRPARRLLPGVSLPPRQGSMPDGVAGASTRWRWAPRPVLADGGRRPDRRGDRVDPGRASSAA